MARRLHPRAADGCAQQGSELGLEGFAQQTQTGCRCGGTKDEGGGLVGAFCRDALCEWDGEGALIGLDGHVHSEPAEEGFSRDSLDVDVNACSAPTTRLVTGLRDDRHELEVSGLDCPRDNGSAPPGGDASREDGEQHGECLEPCSQSWSVHVRDGPEGRVDSRSLSEYRPKTCPTYQL